MKKLAKRTQMRRDTFTAQLLLAHLGHEARRTKVSVCARTRQLARHPFRRSVLADAFSFAFVVLFRCFIPLVLM